jgi:hypothetical protein
MSPYGNAQFGRDCARFQAETHGANAMGSKIVIQAASGVVWRWIMPARKEKNYENTQSDSLAHVCCHSGNHEGWNG